MLFLGWISCYLLPSYPHSPLDTVISYTGQSSQGGKQELSASLEDGIIIYCSEAVRMVKV